MDRPVRVCTHPHLCLQRRVHGNRGNLRGKGNRPLRGYQEEGVVLSPGNAAQCGIVPDFSILIKYLAYYVFPIGAV